MAAVKAKKPVSKLKAGQKKKVNKWLIIGGVAAVAIIGAAVVRFSSAATCKSLTWRQGSSGRCVSNIQGMVSRQLAFSNKSKYLVADGKYGPKTADYVKLFQAYRRIPTTGVVNAETWRQLCSLNMGGSGGGAPQWMNEFSLYAKSSGCY